MKGKILTLSPFLMGSLLVSAYMQLFINILTYSVKAIFLCQ